MTTRKFFVELDFDLDKFSEHRLTANYVLQVVERKLCSDGVEAKVHTENPFSV